MRFLFLFFFTFLPLFFLICCVIFAGPLLILKGFSFHIVFVFCFVWFCFLSVPTSLQLAILSLPASNPGPRLFMQLFRGNQGDIIARVARPQPIFNTCHLSSHYPMWAISIKVMAIGFSFRWFMGSIPRMKWLLSRREPGFGPLQGMGHSTTRNQIPHASPVPGIGMQQTHGFSFPFPVNQLKSLSCFGVFPYS